MKQKPEQWFYLKRPDSSWVLARGDYTKAEVERRALLLENGQTARVSDKGDIMYHNLSFKELTELQALIAEDKIYPEDLSLLRSFRLPQFMKGKESVRKMLMVMMNRIENLLRQRRPGPVNKEV